MEVLELDPSKRKLSAAHPYKTALVEDRTAVKNKIRMMFHQLRFIEGGENQIMSLVLVKELLSRVSSNIQDCY